MPRPKNSKDYWKWRQARRMYEKMNDADKVGEDITRLYAVAAHELTEEVEKVFYKYQQKWGLSHAQAKKLLEKVRGKKTIDVLKAMIPYVDEKVRKDFQVQIEAGAYSYRIRRLEDTMAKLDEIMTEIYRQDERKQREHYVKFAEDSYNREMYEIQKQTGLFFSFSEISEDAINKIASDKCDVCFVSLGTGMMDTFFTMAEEKKLTDVTFIGPRSWGMSDFTEMMKKHTDIKIVFPYASVISGSSEASDALTEEADRFQLEYEARYGSDDVPTEDAALGYDSYLILINAIHNAKSTEGKDIRAAIADLQDLRGATGVFSFDDRGNVVRTVNLSTIKDGKVVSEYVTRSEAEAQKLEDVEETQETTTEEEQ